MMMTQKIAAAIITFTMLAGCVDSTGQGDSDEAEASSQPSPVILQADGMAQKSQK